VSLLIPSYALPPFSYLVPERLAEKVRVGTAVIAPLSGYPRLGIVVGFEEAGDRPLKEIQAVAGGISLPESLVKLCGWAAGAAVLPLPAVLRMALPPGLGISTYEVLQPAPGWPWKAGSAVGRATLYRFLGGEGLKAAERAGRIVFAPTLPARRAVEWAVVEEGTNPELLRRAPRQRALLEALLGYDHGRPVADLLSATGIGSDALRRLVRRGAVRLEKRPEPAPVSYTRGSGAGLAAHRNEVEQALSRGGAWVWRTPSVESIAVAAIARAAVGRGEQALILAPEIRDVERLAKAFEGLLPAGLTVAPYHSGLGRSRAAVYEAARRGEVDVLVGTRAAVLVPVARLGAVCVMDEPNEAHRGSSSYEGVPIHVRDLAITRGRIEDAAVFFLSPFPSLRLYAPESGVLRLPPLNPARWPAVAVVDMRGTGATLSSVFLNACRRTIRSGGRVGVVVNRLGHAGSVSCSRCGFVWTCPACEVPLGLHRVSHDVPGLEEGFLFCGHCGYKESAAGKCPACGSDRLSGAGLATDRVRAELADAFGVEIGLLTAGAREGEGAPVVVGTARCVLEGEWDLVAILDADSLLFGGAGSAEKGFRLLYRAAEASRGRLLVQTRSPENHVLRAALRGDYETFAAAELPKRRALGYPPYAHLAEVTFEGPEEAVWRAVESRLRPVLGNGVELLDPVPLTVPPLSGSGRRPVWRALLRGRKRAAVIKAASLVARLAAETRGRDKLKVRINMNPEEV
jgi:primosomal protein N' (replication factor Y)